jgi:hypothetical protein
MTRFAGEMLLVLGLGACGEPVSAAVKRAEVSQVHRPAFSAFATSSSAPVSIPSVAAPQPPSGLEADAAFVLPIPPRSHAPGSPASGWCGETAIQEGLLHAGLWVSQRLINRAGKPEHPDLYSSDIPVALAGLGVRYTFYSPRKAGFDAFTAWVKNALKAGDPVLAGVKILPTKHPEWGLDHFVLVVGHGPKGLLVNTTWGHRAWVDDEQTEGLSFRNVAYGIRLEGLAVPPHATAARLSVVDEGSESVKLRVSCERLTAGASYRVERTRSASDKRPLWSETVIAVGGRIDKELAVETDRSARFYCIPLSGQTGVQ